MTLPDCYQEVYSMLKFYEVNANGYFASNRAPSKLPAEQKAGCKILSRDSKLLQYQSGRGEIGLNV